MAVTVCQMNNLIEAFVQRTAPHILKQSKAASANMWTDPGQALFPGYTMLQHVFHGHILAADMGGSSTTGTAGSSATEVAGTGGSSATGTGASSATGMGGSSATEAAAMGGSSTTA